VWKYFPEKRKSQPLFPDGTQSKGPLRLFYNHLPQLCTGLLPQLFGSALAPLLASVQLCPLFGSALPSPLAALQLIITPQCEWSKVKKADLRVTFIIVLFGACFANTLASGSTGGAT